MPSILVKYTDTTETAITRSDMPGAIIPASLDNRHFAEVVTLGLDIAPFQPDPVTGEMVNIEAQRRIFNLYPVWKQMNMQRASSPDEVAEAHVAFKWIDAVRVASNALTAMSPIPMDYDDDSYWPASDTDFSAEISAEIAYRALIQRRLNAASVAGDLTTVMRLQALLDA